ncbi:MAG: hypothetical protein ACRDYA_15680 [Egibacteraceae bacterium]
MIYPGPAPVPLRFPFAAAHRAIAAIEAHIQAWEACLKTHTDAASHARVGFEGQVREGFDQALDDAVLDVGSVLDALVDDLEQLQRLVSQAHARIESRNHEIRTWRVKMDAYNEAVDAAQTAS